MSALAAVIDPNGRRVELDQERWQHITDPHDGHPELAALQTQVLHAVEAPDRHRPGHAPNEEWFYLAGAGPSRWLKVVVVFQAENGRIITAFPRRAFP